MHRLAKTVKHVVRHVDDVADGSSAPGFYARRQPFRAWPDCYALDDSCHVARTSFRILDDYFEIGECLRLSCPGQCCRRMHRTMELLPSSCSNLTRKPFVREEVGAVRKNIDDDSRIANRHHVEKSVTRLRIHIERENSLVIGSQSKLAC